MIDKNTVLSVYTDKQTLLEYLTEIETALDKAVLTSSQLVYEGANNYHFKFVFEDGSSIETPSITLVQPISKVDFVANGNSVHFVFTLMDGETITTQPINLLKPVMAAAVRDGILYLTLSDGTEVSAGSITASFGATTFNGDVIVHGNFSQTDGEAVFGGNAEIDGDMKVNGKTTGVKSIEADDHLYCDNFLAPKTSDNRIDKSNTLETTDPNYIAPVFNNITSIYPNLTFSCPFCTARNSNGKLSIVLVLSCDVAADTPAISTTEIGNLTISIPSAIGDKIISDGYQQVRVTRSTMYSVSAGPQTPDFKSQPVIQSVLKKVSSTSLVLPFSVIGDDQNFVKTSQRYIGSFEFNLMVQNNEN